ncbi:5'/3'-nucleotidase SurE [Comamonas serinivorans]|uniref:5'-nucleotidase SurE n=1 Tax=Comamonas serinivorans TaxID=1082851 RepID=A0A1Y0EPU0_9BURK|nr:5'/3'-nucleotidase SurE [Comamonas serinivorans]ARU05667.1 5'/3'-nucleotidase SurE [Comamonas serinivorans]
MKILLSNDDGHQALGLMALFAALKDIADVEVVAPEHNNSAKSNALTLNAPLYVHQAGEGVRYVNGTPADCVHIALTGLLDYTPDLVISGINNGANMGDDTIYSGTVGAAMEGYLFGIPAIAFSLVDKGWPHLDTAVAAAKALIQDLAPMVARRKHEHRVPPPWLLNVNVPSVPLGDLQPPKICRLGRRHSAERVIQQLSPRGDTMYWIGAAGATMDGAPGTDFHATAQGHVAITPLMVDLTAHQDLAYWSQALHSMRSPSQQQT